MTKARQKAADDKREKKGTKECTVKARYEHNDVLRDLE